MTFVKVAETPEILPGQVKVVKFEEKEILIVNVNSSHYAMVTNVPMLTGIFQRKR